MLARQSQVHQSYLSADITGTESMFQNTLSAQQNYLATSGFSQARATIGALAAVYNQLNVQANLLAYIDIIWFFAIFSLCMVPLVMFMKKIRAGTVSLP